MLAALILASGMAFLLGSALGVALPAIQSSFRAKLSGVQWVMNAHLLVESALLPASGALADLYGRRRTFVIGIVLFGLSGGASALVPDVPSLILTQACQGFGGALMIPGSLALIQTHIREADRGLAIGGWAGVSAATAACGAPLGGVLVETAGWRAIFALVVPLSAMAALLSWITIPASRPRAPGNTRRPDWPGTLLLAASLFGLSYALIFLPHDAPVESSRLSPEMAGLAGAALLVAFVIWQRHAPHPMIPGRLFEHRDVIAANLITVLLYCALNGTLTFSTFYLQQIQAFPPRAAGLAFLPTVIFIAIFSGPGGWLADRRGLRFPLVLGTLLVGAGISWVLVTLLWARPESGQALVAYTREAPGFVGGYWRFYARHFLPALMLIGLGMAAVIAPVSRAALRVADDLSGTASGINNAASRVAFLLSVALLGALLSRGFLGVFEPALSALDLPDAAREALYTARGQLGALEIPTGLNANQTESVRSTIAAAFQSGYLFVLLVCAALTLVAGTIAALLVSGDQTPESVAAGARHT